MKALQTCKSVFSKHASSPASVLFIHNLGTDVVELVRVCGKGEMEVVVEATQVLEALLADTPTTKR